VNLQSDWSKSLPAGYNDMEASLWCSIYSQYTELLVRVKQEWHILPYREQKKSKKADDLAFHS